MLENFVLLLIFAAKALIIVLIVLFLVVMVLVMVTKARDKIRGRLIIRNINQKLDEIKELLLQETLSKSEFKKFLKDQKSKLKEEKKQDIQKSKVYVLNFMGDIRASAVGALSEEITSVLTIATPQDEVVVKLESAGGMVHSYGFAAAQLQRIRDKNIPLTIIVDKMAASGGYLMACVADKLLAAPFAIIGSIGVIFQLPNFNRVLHDKHIDFEQITAGSYKRTLTMFGKNTEEGREKLRQELEDIHVHFKDLILEYRKNIDIKTVATGEHWLAKHAIKLHLVDALMTSDDYLLSKSETSHVYEIIYEIKQPLSARFKLALEQYASFIL